MSVKEKVQQKLQDTGSLSSADLGSFDAPEPDEEAEKKSDPLADTTVSDVPEQAKDDVVMAAHDRASPESVAMAAMHNDPAGLLFDRGEIELTPVDKQTFLTAIVDDRRFELDFELFDGRLEVTFRSRTNAETRAVLQEMRRQLVANEIDTEIEYTTRLRHALMRFQLKQLNGEEYPPPEEPLAAQVSTDENGKKQVTPPQWVQESEAYFQGHEARTTAIYNALCIFESKYWTLTENANNQDFWKTEDSTSE